METKIFYETIGQKLKKYRKQCGLTQEQAGKAVGITKSAIVNYETGIRKIPVDVLIELTAQYKVSLDQLLNRQPTISEVIESEIGKKKLTEKQESLLVKYIELLIGSEEQWQK